MISSNRRSTRVVIVGGGAAALESKYALRDLGQEQVLIEVIVPEKVISVDRERHRLLLHDRSELSYDFLVAAMSPESGHRIVGLPFDGDGYIPVDPFGLIEGCFCEYAAGGTTSSLAEFEGTTAERADVVAATVAAEASWSRPEPEIVKPFETVRTTNRGFSAGKLA